MSRRIVGEVVAGGKPCTENSTKFIKSLTLPILPPQNNPFYPTRSFTSTGLCQNLQAGQTEDPQGVSSSITYFHKFFVKTWDRLKKGGTTPSRSMRFFKNKGFSWTFDGFFLKTKGFLPRHTWLLGVMPLKKVNFEIFTKAQETLHEEL